MDSIIISRKRNNNKLGWDPAGIIATLTSEDISVEAPLDAFTNRLTAISTESVINSIPLTKLSELTWSFRQDTISIIVKDVVTEALKLGIKKAVLQVMTELKQETTKVRG